MLPVFVPHCQPIEPSRGMAWGVFLSAMLVTFGLAAAGCAGLGIDHALTQEYTGDTRYACMARAHQTVARREARAYGRFVSAQQFLDLAQAARDGGGDPASVPPLAQRSSLSRQHQALSAALARWAEGSCGCASAKAFFIAWQDSLAENSLDTVVPRERLADRRTRYEADYTAALARCEAGQ